MIPITPQLINKIGKHLSDHHGDNEPEKTMSWKQKTLLMIVFFLVNCAAVDLFTDKDYYDSHVIRFIIVFILSDIAIVTDIIIAGYAIYRIIKYIWKKLE